MKMKRVLLLLAVMLSLSAICYGQEGGKHRIDKELEQCLDKNQSTAGMVECIGKSYDKWDKEMNRVYGELMKKLSPQGKAALKDTQLQWIKFRDLEFKFQDSIYSKMEGTMYIPMSADDRMKIVRSRSLELQAYLDLLKEGQ